jgi:methionyl-tRNA formyltransferase
MRILFAGSPDIAVPSLKALAESRSGFEIAGVLTNPDSSQKRGAEPIPTAVGAAAALRGIPVLKPEKLDQAARDAVSALQPDLLVSFAYGHIFGPKFLAVFQLGGLNIHPSLLPKYRGPSPVQAAILNRDSETGVSIQRLALEMDAGVLLAQERFPLSTRETSAGLSETISVLSAGLLMKTLKELSDNTAIETPQTGTVSYCSMLKKEDGLIDWSLDAENIDAQIRAFTPWPLSWTFHNSRKLFILEARPFPDLDAGVPLGTVTGVDPANGVLVQTGRGLLGASKLQYEAKKPLDWKSFLNGAKNFLGSCLEDCENG